MIKGIVCRSANGAMGLNGKCHGGIIIPYFSTMGGFSYMKPVLKYRGGKKIGNSFF